MAAVAASAKMLWMMYYILKERGGNLPPNYSQDVKLHNMDWGRVHQLIAVTLDKGMKLEMASW